MASRCRNFWSWRWSRSFAGGVILALVAGCGALAAVGQYPGQLTKSATEDGHLRSVAVLEWTGEVAHPKSARLVPVLLFDGKELRDASVYLARPQPLAVSRDVEYQIEQNGQRTGLFEVANAGQEQGSWVGYGKFHLPPAPKPKASMKEMAKLQVIDEESDKPVLHRKHHPEDEAAKSETKTGNSSAKPAEDGDRPRLHRKDTAADEAKSDGAAPAASEDPDRPVMKRRSASEAERGGENSTTASTGSDAKKSDPDQPKLKKSKKKKDDGEANFSEAIGGLTDPDRPRLKRGRPNEDGVEIAPTLVGLPENLLQAVAVSDEKDRPEHLWRYDWSDPADAEKMKAALEDVAREALGLKTAPSLMASGSNSVSASSDAKSSKTTGTGNVRGRGRNLAQKPAPPEPAKLAGEIYRVFELSYDSGATLVLTAHTDDPRGQQRHVTLIAQPDLYGNALVLKKSVADDRSLDDEPRLRLIDAVDALADNRGELLFEARGATKREFVLYRVTRGEVEELFRGAGGEFAPSR